jgi:hypothetical protein
MSASARKPKKEKNLTYQKDDVKIVILRILNETIDRKILQSCFEELELNKIVGEGFVHQIFTLVNQKEIESDRKEASKWIEFLEEGMNQ